MARIDEHDLRFNTVLNQLEYDSGALVWLTTPRVGSLSLTDVHADINTTTIFTPTVSGMYLLSFYGLATTAPTGTDAAPNLYTSWTDEHGTQTCFDFAGNLDQTYTDGPNSSSRPIYAMANTPITFRTSAGDYSGTVRWSFHFTVTAL
jgi:hypothetical protein